MWDSQKVKSSESLNITYNGKQLQSSKIYYWSVRVWDKNGEVSTWSKPANFITGIINQQDFKGEWVTINSTTTPEAMPLYRKRFSLNENPKNAVLHISGLGYYEVYINGKKVGDHVLDPGQTNYDDYAFYVTYKIDSLLQKGENTIGVMLGDGWYHQDKVWGGKLIYGKPTFWCQLDLFTNPFKQIISDQSWQWNNGPIISSNVYAGEVYDARKEIEKLGKKTHQAMLLGTCYCG